MAMTFLGALVLGVWLWVLIDESILEGGDAPWGWSFVGLLMAAGVYGVRATRGGVRIALWIALGLAVGILTGAAFTEGDFALFAGLIAFIGGGLIAAAVPTPADRERARTGPFQVDDDPA